MALSSLGYFGEERRLNRTDDRQRLVCERALIGSISGVRGSRDSRRDLLDDGKFNITRLPSSHIAS